VIAIRATTEQPGEIGIAERLSAPLGLPDTRAGSKRTLAVPGTGSHGPRQTALALGLLAGT
jgi:hypothetical protein